MKPNANKDLPLGEIQKLLLIMLIFKTLIKLTFEFHLDQF